MKNKPTHNYAWAMTLPPRYQWCLTGGFLAVVCLTWWFFVYSSIKYTIVWYQKEVTRLSAQALTMEQARRSCRVLQEDIKRNTELMARYKMPTGAQQVLYERTCVIVDALEKNGLQLHHCTKAQIREKDWYKKALLHLECTGPMQNILQFFNQLAASHKMIQCNDVHLAQQSGDQFRLVTTVSITAVS